MQTTISVNWGAANQLDCVIICGGLGTRMLPLTLDQQKTMLHVARYPLLYYVIEYWKKYCRRFLFVTSYQGTQVKEFVNELSIQAEILAEAKPMGIAKALQLASDHVGDHFITVLGDCLCDGKFMFPSQMQQGVGVTHTANPLAIHQSYSVAATTNGTITGVVEKPNHVTNQKCGMGVYFFSRAIFDYIDRTPPSNRNGKIELTDVIQTMIDHGEVFNQVFFEGSYINVSYPEDLLIADRIAQSLVRPPESGLCVGMSAGNQMEWMESVQIPQIPDVLVFRTVPLGMFRQAIRFLRMVMDIQRLTVLTQPSFIEEVRGEAGVDGCETFVRDGMFKWSMETVGLIRRLRRQRYDAVVVLYNNPNRTGYIHLEILAKLVAKTCYGLVPGEMIVKLNWWKILRQNRFTLFVVFERALFNFIRTALYIRRKLMAWQRS